MPIITPTSVPDPDPEIRRGPGHPDPEIRGWGRGGGGGSLQKFFFGPFVPQFGLKMGGAGPPGPLP